MHGIKHPLTKVYDPETNGQVERTPFKVTCEAWTKNPERFITNSYHLILAPYSRPGSECRDH